MAFPLFVSAENGSILPPGADVVTNQINFVWQNLDGQADIFITSDPSQNGIIITLQNTTGGPLVFTGGDGPYAIGTSGSDWTVIYLVFQGLIPDGDIKQMSLTSSSWVEWANGTYYDSTNGQYLAIAPASTFTLAAGGTVTFNLANVAPADAVAQTGPVNFSWSVLNSGVNPPYENVTVQVANPPDNNNLNFQPVLSFEGTNIVPIGSSLTSTMTLSITNPLSQALVPGGGSSWGNNKPQFFVNFVFDDTTGNASAGALTTTDLAADLTVTLVTDNGNGWQQPSSNGNLGWTIALNSSPGTVLGIGDLATVELSINNIQVAAAAGTTELLLSWTQIPGVNDGQAAIPILKVNPITINSFSVQYQNSYDSSPTTVDAPNPATITNPTGPIASTFSYNVDNASFVMITNTPYAKAVTGSASDTVTIDIDSSGTYTLLATNYSTAQQAALSLPVTVTPDVYSLFPLGTVIMWAGSMGDWPSQWVLCDGNQAGGGAQINGLTIPDLRDRFAIGAGGTTTSGIGDSGDPDNHYHDVVISQGSLNPSGNDGNHTHSLTFNWTGCMSSGHTSHYYLLNSGNHGSDIGCSTGTQTYTTASSQGDHSHTIPPQNATYSTTYQYPNATLTNTRPAWYALAYIVKVY